MKCLILRTSVLYVCYINMKQTSLKEVRNVGIFSGRTSFPVTNEANIAKKKFEGIVNFIKATSRDQTRGSSRDSCKPMQGKKMQVNQQQGNYILNTITLFHYYFTEIPHLIQPNPNFPAAQARPIIPLNCTSGVFFHHQRKGTY